MTDLSNWGTSDLAAIRERERRYRELNTLLAAHVKADTKMSDAEADDLLRHTDMLAGDVRRLLDIITQLKGSIEGW